MALLLLLTVTCWMSVDSGSVHRNISAVEGQDATLPCEALNKDQTISLVEWSRPDQKNQEIFLYRDGHIDPNNHPSYKNRVNLKDRAMKDGDVSLILRNVMPADGGIYECYVVQSEGNTFTSSISLSVAAAAGDSGGRGEDRGTEDGGREDRRGGHVGLIVGLTVAALVVGGVGVVMFLRHQKKKSQSNLYTEASGDS